MTYLRGLIVACVTCVVRTSAQAQNKYDAFVGQYMAAQHIAVTCDGLKVSSIQSAGTIGKEQSRLRRQKVLRLLYYRPFDSLQYVGAGTLKLRDLDPDNKTQICRFGRKVAETNDTIGRFLHK